MTRCSVQPRNRVFVKGYGFLSFVKNMGRNIGKNISKSLTGKYSQKPLQDAKQSAKDTIKTSPKRVIKKRAESSGHSVGNKSANKIGKLSKNSQQSNSETVTNDHDKQIPKQRYASSEERQEIIDKL